MQKKQSIKILLFLLYSYILFWGNFKEVKAESASLTLDSKTLEVEKGDEVIVTLSVDTDTLIGGFEAYLSYNPNVFDFQSGGKYVSGDEGLLLISDLNNEAITKSKFYSITFKAIDTGICQLSIHNLPKVYEYEGGTELSVSSNDLEITVETAKELSNNCNLSSLKISPGLLKPSFSSSITEYETSIAPTADELYVSAIAQDAEAFVTMYGNKNLKTGENKVEIVVKAPSGDQKKYLIVVNKEEKAQTQATQEQAEEKETKQKEKIKGFSVKDKNGKIYLKNSYQYQIVKLKDKTKIPKGYIETSLVLGGVTLTAYTLEENLENDFVLFYAKNKNGEKNFYQYDRIEKTLQRYLQKTTNTLKEDTIIEETTNTDQKTEQLYIVIAVIAGLMILFAIGMITMYLKYKKALEGEDDFE